MRSWYVADRARRLARGQVRSYDMLGHRVAVWRDDAGSVHALDAVCPHLGADLEQGRLVDGCLECPFHHWRYDTDGRCRWAPGHEQTPDRRARRYAVEERYGLIWIFNGPNPTFDLPFD